MFHHRPFVPMLIAVIVAGLAGPAAAAGRPVTVSPGSPDRLLEVGTVCPTFSWVADPEAGAQELRVYRVVEAGELPSASTVAVETDDRALSDAELVLGYRPPAGASSWTPSTAECLQPGGRYAWLLRGGGEWSEVRTFQVAAPERAELERAVEEVLSKLAREGRLESRSPRVVAPGATGAGPAGGAGPDADAPRTRASTTGESAFLAEAGENAFQAKAGEGAFRAEAEKPDPKKVTFGVKGVSFSTATDSAGVVGFSDAEIGLTYGVLGVSDSATGRGVEGFASSLSGKTFGLSGIANSASGSGVRGSATATSGVTSGVQGTAFSPSGFGGLFQNLAGPGPGGIGLKTSGGGGAADLELGGSGGILVDGPELAVDFGEGKVLRISPSGDVTAARFIGDGSQLTGIEGIGPGDLLDDSVLSRHIKDGEVKSADLGANSVDGSKILDESIGVGDIGPGAVGSSEVIDGSIRDADVDTTTVQRRVSGSCPPGTMIREVKSDGSVVCETPGIECTEATSEVTVEAARSHRYTVTCSDGKTAVSGGVVVVSPADPFPGVVRQNGRAKMDRTTWITEVANDSQQRTFWFSVLCCDVEILP